MLNVSEVRSCFAANNVIRGGSEPRRDRLDQRDRLRESSSPIRRAGASVAQCESLALSRLVGCMRHTTCSPAVGHERTWSHARESGASTGAPWPARPLPSDPRPSQLWPEKFGPETCSELCAPTAGDVIVDHAGRLHERIHGRRTDEAKPSPAEFHAHGCGLRCNGG